MNAEERIELEAAFEKTREQMKGIAKALDEVLRQLHGERMGFVISVFEFGAPGIGNYISNCRRGDAIEALRELADRLETGEHIVSVEGEEDEQTGNRDNNENTSG
jgi:hypothetical protein